MTVRSFRILLTAHLASLLAAVVVAVAFPQLLPAVVAEAYTVAEAEAMRANPWAWTWPVIGPLAVAIVAGYVGLFLIRPWGRTISLVTTVVGLAFYPVLGPTIAAWPDSALTDVSNILWGAVLAIAYFGPVSTHFRANNSRNPTPLRDAA